jgi:purine-cytosine permease-like protein
LLGVYPVEALLGVGDNLYIGFGLIAVMSATVANLSIMSVNMHGGMLTEVTAADGFEGVPTTRSARIIDLIIVGAMVLAVALLLSKDLFGSVDTLVLLMLYFLVSRPAVNLVGFSWVRRGKYATTEIFKPRGI